MEGFKLAQIKQVIPTEHQEQVKFVSWMRKNGIRHYAIPNGSHKSMHEALKFKAEGLVSGVPDICVPIASGSYHGCYIELKRIKGGKLSDTQIEWIDYLRRAGYYADWAAGFEEAKKIILKYLDFEPKVA